MPLTPLALDLADDVISFIVVVCDIESVSLDERALADAVETALRPLPHLTVARIGNTVVARTDLGRAERVVLAGHIDTVPLTVEPANLPTRRVQGQGGEVLWGRGTVDMKGGVAVMLRIAHEVREPSRDLTFVFYEAEEIDSVHNGLLLVQQQAPDLLADADFAVLLEPTDARIEGGCKGTLRAEVSTKGIAAHSARPWKGHNAIHDAAEVLARLAAYEPVTRVVDELEFREALGAVLISGGTATNVIPDRCVVTVTTATRPRSPRRMPRRTFARSSPVSTWWWSTTPAVPARGCTFPRPRRSSRPWASRSRPSRAGPTWPASPPSACRP